MLFNGTSSRAETSGAGGVATTMGAFTLAAIVNRTSSSGFRNVINFHTAAGASIADLTFNGTTMLYETNTGSTSNGPTIGTGRMFVAFDKASGSVTPRFHKKIYGTDAAVAHSNGSASATGGSGTVASIGLGAFDRTGDWWAGDMYVAAIWNRQLADWEHEWLADNLGAWFLLNPDWLVFGDYAALPTNIPDLSGGGAPLTTLTNLAVSTVSGPVGYGAPILVGAREPGTGAQTIQPGHVASTEQVFAPTFALGGVTVQPGHVASGEQVFAPTLTSNFNLQPGHVASTAQTFAPTLSPGAVTIQPGHVASTAQVFAPSLSGGATLTPNRVESTEQVFAPTFAVGAVTVTPGFLAAGSQVFQPTLTGGDLPEGPTPGTMMPTLGVG